MKEEAIELFQQGRNLFSMRKYQEAREKFMACARLEENFAEAHYYIGLCFQQEGVHDKSRDQFSIAIKIKPDDGLYWEARGRAYQYLRQLKEALSDYAKALELYSGKDEIGAKRVMDIIKSIRDSIKGK